MSATRAEILHVLAPGLGRPPARAFCGLRAGARRPRRGRRADAMKAAAVLLLALTSVAAAGELTTQNPASRSRPGSFSNPYELREGGRVLGEYYDNGPGDPGSYTNPYRFHPRADGAEDDGFNGFG